MANPKTLQEWITFYNSIGWIIIPIKDKKPLCKWGDDDPYMPNYWDQDIDIAVATGQRSGIVCIDCDMGGHSVEETDEKTKAFIKKVEETNTKKFNTRTTGNFQYIFRLPPDKGIFINNRIDVFNTSANGYQLDIRGNGGYSVIPPSKGYAWANNNKILEMPGWLVKELSMPSVTNVPRSQVSTLPEEGDRHGWYMSESASMLAKGWTYEKVEAHLLAINASSVPSLEEEDLRGLIQRIYNLHIRNQQRKLKDNGQAPVSWYVDDILNTPKLVEPELTTGIDILDKKVWGYQRGRFTVIAGVSNAGKSLLMHSSILGNLKKQKKCMLFTPETAGKFVVQRLCIMETGIESTKFVTNDFSQDDLTKINEFKNQTYLNNLIIYEETPTIEYIINQVKLNKPDIVFLDYFSMIAFTSYSHWEIKEGVELLHNLARSQNIAVVCAEQLGDVYMSFYDQEKKQSKRIRVDSHDGDVRTSKVLKYTANLFLSLNHYENHETHQTLLKLNVCKNKITPYMPIVYMELDKNHLKYNIITEERFLAIKGV